MCSGENYENLEFLEDWLKLYFYNVSEHVLKSHNKRLLLYHLVFSLK